MLLFVFERKGSRIRRFLCHRYTIVAVVVRSCGGGGGGGGSCNCPAPDEERVGYRYCGESAFVVIKAT